MTIKNLKFKLFLVKYIFSIFSFFNKRISHKENIILIYSNLTLRDNSLAIYDFIVQHKYYDKYKIIISSTDYKLYKNLKIKNIKFVGALSSIYWYIKSKYIIYSFGKIPIDLAKDQKSIYLNHGMPMKDGSEGQYKQRDLFKKFYSLALATGKAFIPCIKKIYGIPEERIILGGNPKCDLLFLPSPNYNFGSYKKLILWAPTFRKSSSMNMNDSTNDCNIIPIIKEEQFAEFNDFLKKIEVKIIIKLHPEQDLSKYKNLCFSHFILMSHQEFTQKNMDINRLMKQADALITDYSSIFYDFLLLDRPIGFTEDDLKEYKRGFAIDLNKFRPGEKLITFNDVCKFVNDVAINNDRYQLERNQLNKEINEYNNGGFCKRVLDIMDIKK